MYHTNLPITAAHGPGKWTPFLAANLMARARIDPNEFIEYCFTDHQNKPLQQARIHRTVQEFLSTERNALVELPRDHGKSTQVCGRILWELGQNPGLRVRLFCASKAMAQERGQFLREALESNERLREVFPI